MSLVVALLFAVVFHEAGHALAAEAQGSRWEVYARFPVSIGIRSEPSRITGAAGPAASLVLAGLGFAVGWQTLGMISLLLGVLSLLPFKGNDGHRIFR